MADQRYVSAAVGLAFEALTSVHVCVCLQYTSSVIEGDQLARVTAAAIAAKASEVQHTHTRTPRITSGTC